VTVNRDGCKYLIFTLSEDLFAFELSQVAEVREPQTLWPIPAAPPYYRGAMNSHGSVMAIMDLADFLGFSGNRDMEKLVVLHESIGALALLVERVIRIVPADQVEPREGSDRPFALGTVLLSEGEATLLDAGAITERATETINSC